MMNSAQPNTFAFLMLLSWPIVAFVLYQTKSVVTATIWTALGAQLLLPSGTYLKFELIPQIDKDSLSSVCVLLGGLAWGRRAQQKTKFGLIEVIALIYVAGPVVTSVLNGDPIYVGDITLPGVGVYDGLSALLSQSIILIPFFVGRRLLGSSFANKELLFTLVVAGLGYSIPLLFEIRFSPQLHYWIYGYYSSNFIQEMREGGGFRPVVFMGHGLATAFFAMTATVAAAAMWRSKTRLGVFCASGITAYLATVLVLCKSGAALIYGCSLVPLIRWSSAKTQMRIAVILSSLALTYPLLRIAEVFPTQELVDLSMAINEPRGYSLKFRFDQEEVLLERALQRFVFGWGRFGRSRVFVEDYRGIGGDASVTDGRWIISLGQFGIIGFLAEFGLLAIPIFRANKVLKATGPLRDGVFLGALSLLVAVDLIDLLINSTLTPWNWMLAGSLLGRSEALQTEDERKRALLQPSRRATSKTDVVSAR
jgi:hypothetical protein